MRSWIVRQIAVGSPTATLLLRSEPRAVCCQWNGRRQHIGSDPRQDRLACVRRCPGLRGRVAKGTNRIEIVAQQSARDGRRDEARNAIFSIVELGAVYIALARWRIHNEQRRVKAGGNAAHLLLQPLRGRQRQPKMLRRLHHIAQIDIVRMNVDPTETLDEGAQSHGIVVHPAQQYGLIGHEDALLVQAPHRGFHHRSYLVGVVEMRVHTDILEHGARAPDKLHDGGHPVVICQDLHRLDREDLGGKAHSPNVLDIQERISEQAHVRRLQAGEIATRYDNVLYLRMRPYVVEGGQPSLRAGDMILDDQLRVLTDGIAARAILTVYRTNRGHEKQDLIRISVHDAADRRMGPFGERIDFKARVIVLLLTTHRKELTTNRVRVSVGPVDQAHHVRIEPDRHTRPAQAGLDLRKQTGGDNAIERRSELRQPGDRMTVLPGIILEVAAGNVFPELEPPPLNAHRRIFSTWRLAG